MLVGMIPLLGFCFCATRRDFCIVPTTVGIMHWFTPKAAAAADPHSIEGRRTVGYWDDAAKSGEAWLLGSVDATWDAQERQMVVDYLEQAFSSSDTEDTDPDQQQQQQQQQQTVNNNPRVLQVWRGLATCRLCDEIVGNACHGDDQYNWPEGYRHYLVNHEVRPPQHFVEHVRVQRSSSGLPQQQQEEKKKEPSARAAENAEL